MVVGKGGWPWPARGAADFWERCVCPPSVCPKLILHGFKCSFCSRDGLDNIHNCGRFLRNFSVVPPPGSFAHFLIYLNLFLIYTENIFGQAADSCDWWCWKGPDFLSISAVGLLVWVAIFRVYNYVLLTGVRKTHIFSLFYTISSRTHFFCLFLSLVSLLPISPLLTDDRELLIKAEEVIFPQVKNGSFCLCEVCKLPN